MEKIFPLSASKLFYLFSNILKKGVGKLFKYLYRIELQGLENYPIEAKRLIIIANHVSLLDAVLLWLFLPTQLTFVINLYTAQKWWAAWVKPFAHLFLVDPLKPMAIKSLIEYIATNKHCVIFPEGRITTTGGLMKIYEGPGLVADRTQALLLPIHIEGAQLTHFSRLRNKQKLHFFPKIKLTIFPPRTLVIPDNLIGRQRRKFLREKLYELLCEIEFLSRNFSKTLFESLLEAKKCHGKNKIILEDLNRNTLTYRQLITRSFILKKAIQPIAPSSKAVGILLPNINSHPITFFALQLQNCIPALLNFSMGKQQLIQCCKSADLKIIFTARIFIENAHLNETITALQNEGIHMVFLDELSEKITSIHRLIGFFQSLFPLTYYKKKFPNPADPAIILFTSGSEGDPKGVVLSHKNLQSNRFQLLTRLSFTSQDTLLNALPLFHAFSLNAGLLLPMFLGVRTILYPTPLHFRKIPELCYDLNATILFSADTFLAIYGKYADPYDFYNLRYVFAGAEKLKADTYQQWLNKFGLRILEGYGTTETSPTLAANNPMQNKYGTVGKLLPGIEYQLHPIAGINKGGELYVKGPNVMLGYLVPEKPGNILAPKEGWHATGDIAFVDEEGFITICDRVKRFAKVGGEMIALSAVEAYITALWPGFLHAALASLDPRKGEQIILITTFPNANRQAIIQQAKKLGLPNLMIPKTIKVITKMPLLATGKINYRALGTYT